VSKICPCCNQTKNIDDFYKDKTTIDGLNYRCKECLKNYNSKFRLIKNIYDKNYRLKHIEKARKRDKDRLAYRIEYKKNKFKNDPEFRIKHILRVRFNKILKINKTKKTNSVLKLLGCTLVEFRQHLEQQFKPEMNWSNHGTVWEIDHIIGCTKFNLTIIEEQAKCFHYTNTQPLFKTTEIAESFGYTDEIGNRNKSKKYE